MARNGSGTYSLPQAPFTPGTTIASAAVNSDLSDIGAALTQSISKDGQTVYTGNQPMGGNKLTGLGIGSSPADSVRVSQVADGAINYGGTAGGTADAITLSPTPGITAYAAGQTFTFKAASTNTGAMTVDVSTVGAGALVWPNGTAMAAGDIVSGGVYEIAVSAATPVFHLQNTSYPPLARTGGTLSGTLTMSGAAINNAVRVDVASATTTDIGAAASNYVQITGTTTITGLGTIASGVYRDVVFAGALTLTHNATSLILPTGANITTAAGDTAVFASEGSGNWRCLSYQRATGRALKGSVLQMVSTTDGTYSTNAATIPVDNTKPQSSEGTEFLSQAITPISATSKLVVEVTLVCAATGNDTAAVALFRDSGTDAIAAVPTFIGGFPIAVSFRYEVTSGSTSATTFKVRAGCNTNNILINGVFTVGAVMDGLSPSSITITEYQN